MCEIKPGLRCAADTRDVARIAVSAFDRAFPGGPAVDPIASANAQFVAGSSALAAHPRWRSGQDAAGARAHQLMSRQSAASARSAMRALEHLAAIGKSPVPQTI